MMEFSFWRIGCYWSVSVLFNRDGAHNKEISIEDTKRDRYWGYRYEEDLDCHSLGFYFFELCYYA